MMRVKYVHVIIAMLAGTAVAGTAGIWLEPLTFDWALWVTYQVTDDPGIVSRVALSIKAIFMAILPAFTSAVMAVYFESCYRKHSGLTFCGSCNHILKGLSEPRCPECGNLL